jgi:DNA polymerase
MTALHIDATLSSPTSLDYLYRCVEDPGAEVVRVDWAIGDGAVSRWLPGQPCPKEIATHRGRVVGWGIGFERLVWAKILGPRHGWPVPPLQQFDDTMAMAMAMALPREAEAAMKLLDVPLCGSVIENERAVRRKLFPLSQTERAVWRLDQLVNDRGVGIDTDLVRDMMAIVKSCRREIDRHMATVTEGAITSVSQTGRLKTWLTARGVEADELGKDAIDAVIAQPMLEECREALSLWQEGSKTSLAKLPTALECTSRDGRARGLLVYHGAHSGRWTSHLLQLQNLPRTPGGFDQDRVIDFIRHRSLAFAYDQPLTTISNCLRGIITAAPGHVLMVGDFRTIESRVGAWLAGDKVKLDDFRKADRGEGPDLYRMTAARIYGVPIGDDDPRRQTGKTTELALGFGGGVDALAKMATKDHVDLATTFDAMATPGERAGAHEHGEKAQRACAMIVQAWRDANTLTVATWGEFEGALREAISTPGEIVEARNVAFRHRDRFLGVRLPSGRVLYYPQPVLHGGRVTVYDREEGRRELYGGLIFHNITQAIARDLLAEAMIRLEAAGLPVVLSVHDEIVCEVPAGDLEQFRMLLCTAPHWAAGLPIAVKGWSGFRYH